MKIMTELQQLEEQARAGDKARNFLKEGGFAYLNDEILEPLDRAAFETFKKVDPANVNEVMQAQMMSKVIHQIKKTIEDKIALGDYARQQLLTYSTPDEEGE